MQLPEAYPDMRARAGGGGLAGKQKDMRYCNAVLVVATLYAGCTDGSASRGGRHLLVGLTRCLVDVFKPLDPVVSDCQVQIEREREGDRERQCEQASRGEGAQTLFC